MEETFVKEKVREWLASCHDLALVATPGPDVIGTNMQFDLKGQQPLFRDIRVECKGTNADMDKAIGQTLRYFCEKPNEKIYLAVPEDYKSLEKLQKTVSFLDLPVGLLIVRYNGEIEVLREPKNRV